MDIEVPKCFFYKNSVLTFKARLNILGSASKLSILVLSGYDFAMEQHIFFTFSFVIEGATEKVSQFILPHRAVFTTLYFLRYLQMGPMSLSVTLH